MLNAAGKKKKDRFFNLAWQKVPMDPKNKNKVRAQFDAPRSAVAVGVAGVCMWLRVCVARTSVVRGGEASNDEGCALCLGSCSCKACAALAQEASRLYCGSSCDLESRVERSSAE